MTGGIIFGSLLAMARLSGIKPLVLVATVYVNLMRSIPLVLVIFWFYFLVPLLGQWLTTSSTPITVGPDQTALISFTVDGFITNVNSVFLQTMGYKSNEKNKLIGKHHSIFVTYEYSQSDEYSKFWENLRKGKFFDGIFERLKVDGSVVYLQASYNPVVDSKGNITDVVKIATDVTESVNNKKKIDELTDNLKVELENSQNLKNSIEIEKNMALNDLDVMIKKNQSELIKVIVKCALAVIIGVGIVTTILYWLAIVTNKETQIIGSTWSNMFSVLLTNAFSIVGTIMGIKYATQENNNKK
jgi:His/Glu/Gln/Arg/opine family amino acid ABC transporter permease subunit